jgi:hypothetical protein
LDGFALAPVRPPAPRRSRPPGSARAPLARRRFRSRLPVACLVGALLLAWPAGRAGAVDQKAALAKIKARYETAVAAYDDGQFDRTKSQLLEAIALAKEGGLEANKIVGQIYLLFGVLEVAGLKQPDTGVTYFVKALDISPAIQVPPSMATKAVLAAFLRAENQGSPGDAATEQPASAASTASKPEPGAPSAPKEKAKEAPAPAAVDGKRADAPAKDPEPRGPEDRKSLVDELARARASLAVAQAEQAKLQRAAQDKDKQLADLSGRLQQLEKQKQQTDKQLADVSGRLQQLEKGKPEDDKERAQAKARIQELERAKLEEDKQLAASQDSDKRQRDASEKLEKAKAESDRQLADAKARLQQLATAKLETDKQLAASKESERQQREAGEKLEKLWREATARDQERKARDEQTRLELQRLADGPELPRHFSEAIHCTIPDELLAGADLYVHCAPHPNASAKVLALYYRAAGDVLYNATIMERSKKGWFMGLVPGSKITGKLLQYYVEARDGRQLVTASNGKAASPNIALVRPARARPNAR